MSDQHSTAKNIDALLLEFLSWNELARWAAELELFNNLTREFYVSRTFGDLVKVVADI